MNKVLFNALTEAMEDGETFLDQYFNGVLNSIVECLKCGYKSETPNVFNDITLIVKNPFEGIANKDVREALRTILKKETLDGSNQYNCDKCKSKQDASIFREFSKTPEILTLVIARFDFDYEAMQRIKLNDKFEYKEELDLQEFTQKQDEYELFSVIGHSGTVASGHYTCYIKTEDGCVLTRVVLFQRSHSNSRHYGENVSLVRRW